MTPATVLLVDDEPRVLDALKALLAMEHRILRAERPEIALRHLREEDVAVVVSDQRMAGLTGTELLTGAVTWRPTRSASSSPPSPTPKP